jgi:type II secretory pathway pseudopilin PulG
MSRKGRRALTLIELVAVIAITAVITGLLLAAVTKIREAAVRTDSTNNLKNILLAVHHFADANQQRLPMVNGTTPGLPGLSTHAALLPYIEAGNALALFEAKPPRPSPIIVPSYRSPADPTFVAGTALGYEVSSYAANGQVFKDAAILSVSIRDGTSNTIGFAEHYSYCRSHIFFYLMTGPGLGGNPGPATFAGVLQTDPDDKNRDGSSPPTATFQAAPSIKNCSYVIAQTPHASGMLVAMMDGSVRTISPDPSPQTYWALVTPAGGEIIGDW